ncbi:hydrogenase nickel incorporation protein HypB [Paenibacillus illinoisensis]|uniref:Hydrogenase nickel incorporation protein HypB n=1 Tax=Paenibacillus illinoisensis TaxID=59845 RepID=A0A2W0C0Z8_9BACL|nr:hydrogenase nickel incorporation protein HypB [Paenibacillus illinoisensis]PYY25933.1 Hydrogenase nickel incorporation protein HypB [Paenibacillus illinoisensis]
MSFRIPVQQNMMRGNDEWAKRNRNMLAEHNVFTINMLSSPGAGKTSLLEAVIPRLKQQLHVAVIEGDVYTTLDAERIANLGIPTVQINTQGACHLDAKMINSALQSLPLSRMNLLIIENVGNLVCPASFDLGEDCRVTVISTTEGADKVEKYPEAFQRSHAILLNKIDLLPYLNFKTDQFRRAVEQINLKVPIFNISAITGEGRELWEEWLTKRVCQNRE